MAAPSNYNYIVTFISGYIGEMIRNIGVNNIGNGNYIQQDLSNFVQQDGVSVFIQN